MFEASDPRLFGLPMGVDFPKGLLVGLEQRLKTAPPLDWAKVEIFVNTRRMERRLRDLFDQGPPRLLPRIRLLSDLSSLAGAELPAATPGLRRRLELSQLVAGLLERQPDLAPRSSLYDLADSLAALMDEMHGEGVDPAALHDLDVAHLSDHWERTRAFVALVERFFGDDSRKAPDAEARQRMAVEQLVADWKTAPPTHPIIVAGSTGSRGGTALLMQAVTRLPQGAVVLPGFDFDLPQHVWATLKDALAAEDHPQFRFDRMMRDLGIRTDQVRPWTQAVPAANPARNKLVSLALRPAPVTDQWQTDGPKMTALDGATADMTLIEAPSPRAEAVAIALRLRKAAEDGVSAALISPDRTLTRRVAAVLDRWGIEPDDSAGTPLGASAPGRFLRQISSLFGQKLTGEALLTLLKHPLCASGGDRGSHLLWTRELELKLRAKGPAFPTGRDLIHWAAAREKDDGRKAWAHWLTGLLEGLHDIGTRPLTDHVTHHLGLAEGLAQGPEGEGSGALWDKPAGQSARKATSELADEAHHGGEISNSDYVSLFFAILNRHEVRDPILPHPGIMIWGTLEARVQGAGLVILGGLNEGSWPQLPPPDPWLNRSMRHDLGLLLPERRIGLSAHDFQQAIAAPEVVLSRAVRDAEAETVAARWLNRLTNLLDGLPDQGGKQALRDIRQRGQIWLDLALEFDKPSQTLPKTPRPAPCPPRAARPRKLSVTRIKTLIRDPYAIYAQYVLGLRKLLPLKAEADALTRGTVLHKVFEDFIREGMTSDPQAARDRLLEIADRVFEAEAPWPTARRLWRARLGRVAPAFVQDEARRQAQGHWIALEEKGSVVLQNGFVLSAEADRIDQLNDGGLAIYDYKTGQPPSKKQMEIFDKQLLLEALIAERGSFETTPPENVSQVAYIGLGTKPREDRYPVMPDQLDETWADLHRLVDGYLDPDQGFIPRRILETRDEATDYDQLSRYGEWDESQAAEPIRVGKDET